MKRRLRNLICSGLLLTMLLCTPSCATYDLLTREDGTDVPIYYYLLVPFTFGFDVLFFPWQVLLQVPPYGDTEVKYV